MQALKLCGYDVVAAGSGEQALTPDEAEAAVRLRDDAFSDEDRPGLLRAIRDRAMPLRAIRCAVSKCALACSAGATLTFCSPLGCIIPNGSTSTSRSDRLRKPASSFDRASSVQADAWVLAVLMKKPVDACALSEGGGESKMVNYSTSMAPVQERTSTLGVLEIIAELSIQGLSHCTMNDCEPPPWPYSAVSKSSLVRPRRRCPRTT